MVKDLFERLPSDRNYVLSGRVLTPDGIIENGIVHVKDGVIQSVAERQSDREAIDLDAGENLIAPGFIDIHVHGALNHGFIGADADGMIEALRYHYRHGTTAILATTSTESGDHILQALGRIAEAMRRQEQGTTEGVGEGRRQLGSTIVGVHVEGPYLNERQAGAQNPEWLRNPDLEEYQGWEGIAPIRMITIAPELPGAEPLIRYIRNQGNVLISAGHTDATFAEMEAGMEWGVSHCTHFGNGMRGLHHREPGVFGSGLIQERLTVELIADGVHVHPEVLRLVYRVKGADNTALITDASAFCGLPDGIYRKELCGRETVIENGTIRVKKTGGLSGSSLTMNRGAKRMAELGAPLTDVWKMASSVPARLLGLADRKGEIKAGMDADLIVIDRDFEVLAAVARGEISRWGI
ncbi:MAG: N-acetylglucosamine-6-phosphate deacetylase [Paenibacillaceae bacterium]|jgi:N-acetylglucosamine-6-phosphate deacetylase|nr:N-acetylglucosamine-6-phosphate deacetylase [Paenibacillaceae bacterium]